MSARLHLLCNPDASAWRDCQAMLSGDDCVLLLDRGVECLLLPGFVDGFGNRTARLRILREDAEARGLAALAARQPGLLIGRDDWVRLIEAHPHILSWL